MGAPSATNSQLGPRYAPQQTSILGHVAATGREMPADGDGCVAGPSGRAGGGGNPRQLGKFPFRHTSLALNRIDANSPKGLFLCRRNSREMKGLGAS